VDQKEFPSDDRMVLNMVFLKYATVGEVQKLLQPFLGEGAQMTVYEPANLLLLLDNSRNMRRTMEMIAMFDNDVLAGQRVRLFEVTHGRPSDLARELDQVMRAVSLGGGANSPVRFLPIDRINTLVAIAPNPGVFTQVETWLKKLDIEPKTTSTGTRNYVVRLRYGRAETMAGAIMQLYLGLMFPMFSPFGFGGYGMGGYGMGYGGGMYRGGILDQMTGGYPGGYGGMAGGLGMYGGGMGMYGGGYPGMYGRGAGGYAAMGYPGYGYPGQQGSPAQPGQAGTTGGAAGGTSATSQPTNPGAYADMTGSYLGAGGYGPWGLPPNMPRVIPNPFDNTLLIQATPQDYEQIVRLVEQLDVAPRQILVEAKIYEVNMSGDFSSGIEAFLRRRTGADRGYRGSLSNVSGSPVLRIDAGFLVGQSRELLAAITAAESSGRAKLVSAPSLIATDSVPASINVGDEVPTLAAQAVAGGIQAEGSSLFTQSVVNRQSGVTLNVNARANPSGIVTLVINQDVSAPVAPEAGAAIPSPSFSRRSVNTQVTVEDGDTIAIGGIISESNTFSSAGIPVLHRVPVLGGLFGSKVVTKQRTELVIFMTPRVIHDTNMMREASDELRSKFRKLRDIERD
jgi:general secretion pathway protein D